MPESPLERSLHILLAEDNPINQMVAVTLLQGRGHRVSVAENGRRALELLERARFDVVLMDVQMPEMDGFEATAAIRARERASREHVPIVAITGHTASNDRERCRRAGMDGYLTKPLMVDDLLRALRDLAQRPDQDDGPAPALQLDERRLLELMGGDEGFLDQMLDVFFEVEPKLRDDVQRALAAGDPKNAARAAHTLAGMVSNFGAQRAMAAAARLESLGKAEESPAGSVAEAHGDLARELDALTTALRGFRARGAGAQGSAELERG